MNAEGFLRNSYDFFGFLGGLAAPQNSFGMIPGNPIPNERGGRCRILSGAQQNQGTRKPIERGGRCRILTGAQGNLTSRVKPKVRETIRAACIYI